MNFSGRHLGLTSCGELNANQFMQFFNRVTTFSPGGQQQNQSKKPQAKKSASQPKTGASDNKQHQKKGPNKKRYNISEEDFKMVQEMKKAKKNGN